MCGGKELNVSIISFNSIVSVVVGRIVKTLYDDAKIHNYFDVKPDDYWAINDSDLIFIQIRKSDMDQATLIRNVDEKTRIIVVSREKILETKYDNVEFMISNLKRLCFIVSQKLGDAKITKIR